MPSVLETVSACPICLRVEHGVFTGMPCYGSVPAHPPASMVVVARVELESGEDDDDEIMAKVVNNRKAKDELTWQKAVALGG